MATRRPCIRRLTFNEITKRARGRKRSRHPRDIDQNLVDAQQARRVLDRLVGYQVSPLLWDKVRRGLSAGRVQTVALRLIVASASWEIKAFQKVEYWTIDAHLAGPKPPALRCPLRGHRVEEKVEVNSGEDAEKITPACAGESRLAGSHRRSQRAAAERHSTLHHQQAAAGLLRASCASASSAP